MSIRGLTIRVEEQLGEPLSPLDDEHLAIRNLRDLMASPGDHPDQHLGEAEVITIIEKRQLDALFITDDLKARPYAEPGIWCIGTFDILRLALKMGLINEDELRRIRHVLLKQDRVHQPEVRSSALFEEWLKG